MTPTLPAFKNWADQRLTDGGLPALGALIIF